MMETKAYYCHYYFCGNWKHTNMNKKIMGVPCFGQIFIQFLEKYHHQNNVNMQRLAIRNYY